MASTLARQHAVLFGIGGVKTHAGAIDQMALPGHEGAAVRQFAAVGESAGDVVGDVHAMQPVLHQGAQTRIVELQQADEGFQAGDGFRRRGACRDCRCGRKQRQLGRRSIVEEGLGPIQIRDFQRRGALAQHGFQRGFPALVDMQLLPQPRQIRQFVLLQPRLDLALRLDVFLQLLQGGEARFELRQRGRFGVELFLRRAAGLLQLRKLFLRLLQLHRGFLLLLLLFFQLQLQIGQMRGVGQIQAVLFLRQPFAPHGQIGQNIGGIALMRRFQFDLLLTLHDARARFGRL